MRAVIVAATAVIASIGLADAAALAPNEIQSTFFTGQAFMVKKSLNVAHVKELDGATICVITGTTLEPNIADYSRANNIKINTLLFERPEEAFAAAEADLRCAGSRRLRLRNHDR